MKRVCRSLLMLCCVPVFVASSCVDSYRNDEFGLEVSFPPGGKVCTASSGGHAHGFYAWYGGRETECGSTQPDVHATVLSIYASYNTTFDNSPYETLREECRAQALSQSDAVHLRGLSFAGLASATCMVRRADGRLEIEVVTQAGRFPTGGTLRPRINYTATLITQGERVGEDLALFRRFLEDIAIND